MSSVRKIAQRVGVSVATVSRALNNHPHVDPETRRRVLQDASAAGYTPDRGRQTSTVIGLVYAGEVVQADYGAFESALLSGVLRGLNEHRFDVKILSVQRDKSPNESYSEFFYRKGIRGAILRTVAQTRGICRVIADEGFPSMVVADHFEEPNVNYVWCSSRDDFRRATKHLIDLGHTRIALAVHRVPDTDHLDRERGFREALAEARVEPDPALMIQTVGAADGGASSITHLMSLPTPPTAVMFTNPLATVGALRRCLELGIRVPADLSIVGFDDSDIRKHTYPAFTAVCQDAHMLGVEAARWLTRRVMTDDESARSCRMMRSTFLEINQSTSRPPIEPFRVLPDGTRAAVVGERV